MLDNVEQEDSRFKALMALGAGDFEHLNGSLVDHLKGTRELLRHWGAADYLCDAGLFHAAYGTAGFVETMVDLNQRTNIRQVIGAEAESLVYLYCSCDRDYVFTPDIGQSAIKFKDRFTQERFVLDAVQARAFCELTVANELELVLSSADFAAQYGADLYRLFDNIGYYLSEQAIDAYRSRMAAFANLS